VGEVEAGVCCCASLLAAPAEERVEEDRSEFEWEVLLPDTLLVPTDLGVDVPNETPES
jgi:hypothetical protein